MKHIIVLFKLSCTTESKTQVNNNPYGARKTSQEAIESQSHFNKRGYPMKGIYISALLKKTLPTIFLLQVLFQNIT